MKILHAKDLQNNFNWGRSKSYEIINEIKKRYHLSYKQCFITEENFNKFCNE